MTSQEEQSPTGPAGALGELRARLEAAREAQRVSKSQLAVRTHLSRGTVSKAFSGRAKAPSRDTVRALAKALKLDPEPLLALRETALAEPPQPELAAGESPAVELQGKGKLYWGVSAIGALVVAGLSLMFVGPTLLLVSEDQRSVPACSAAAGRASETPGFAATVTNTEGLGVLALCGPGNSHGRSGTRLLDGDQVTILCQDRDGQVVHDTKGVDRLYDQPWPVWNKLSDETWISDLYVDTPKEPGDMPPLGLPLC